MILIEEKSKKVNNGEYFLLENNAESMKTFESKVNLFFQKGGGTIHCFRNITHFDFFDSKAQPIIEDGENIPKRYSFQTKLVEYRDKGFLFKLDFPHFTDESSQKIVVGENDCVVFFSDEWMIVQTQATGIPVVYVFARGRRTTQDLYDWIMLSV